MSSFNDGHKQSIKQIEWSQKIINNNNYIVTSDLESNLIVWEFNIDYNEKLEEIVISNEKNIQSFNYKQENKNINVLKFLLTNENGKEIIALTDDNKMNVFGIKY